MTSALPLLAFAAVQQAPAIKVDPLLLIEVKEIWSLIGNSKNPVWPGWDARKTPILIYYPGKQDLLLNHPKPPGDYKKYHGPIHSPIGQIYLRDGKTISDLDGQNTSLDVNGFQTLVVADTLSIRRQWAEGLAASIVADPDHADKIVGSNIFPNPYDKMTTFAHEAFHVFQHEVAPQKNVSEMMLAQYPTLSVENNVGMALEADCLTAALHAKSQEEARKHAVDWLAVRQWRRSVIGADAAKYEDGTEFSEGTAKYVEYRTLQLLETKKPSPEMWLVQGFNGYKDLSPQREGLVRAMNGFMSGASSVNNDLYGASPIRFRLYYSGMAIGAMLDKLGFEWHVSILKSPASLTDLAAQAIHASPEQLSEAIAEIRNTKRFKDLTVEKQTLAADGGKYIAEEVSRFEQAPAEVVLDYSGLDNPKVDFSYTPFGILRIDESTTEFRLVPIGGQVNTTTFSEENTRPVIRDSNLKSIRIQLLSAVDRSVLQSRMSSAGNIDLPTLQLPGVKLTNLKAKVKFYGRKIVFHLVP